jgi:hypothetical protein
MCLRSIIHCQLAGSVAVASASTGTGGGAACKCFMFQRFNIHDQSPLVPLIDIRLHLPSFLLWFYSVPAIRQRQSFSTISDLTPVVHLGMTASLVTGHDESDVDRGSSDLIYQRRINSRSAQVCAARLRLDTCRLGIMYSSVRRRSLHAVCDIVISFVIKIRRCMTQWY